MVLSFQYNIHHGATKRSSLRIEQCVWIYTICPCNARAPVGQLIWVSAFSKPRFRLACNKRRFLSYNIWNLRAKNVAWSKPHSFACAFSTPALFWRCAFPQNFATVESAAPYFWGTTWHLHFQFAALAYFMIKLVCIAQTVLRVCIASFPGPKDGAWERG